MEDAAVASVRRRRRAAAAVLSRDPQPLHIPLPGMRTQRLEAFALEPIIDYDLHFVSLLRVYR